MAHSAARKRPHLRPSHTITKRGGRQQAAGNRHRRIAEPEADHRDHRRQRRPRFQRLNAPTLIDDARPGASLAACITRICTGGTMANAAAPQASMPMTAPTCVVRINGNANMMTASAPRKILVAPSSDQSASLPPRPLPSDEADADQHQGQRDEGRRGAGQRGQDRRDIGVEREHRARAHHRGGHRQQHGGPRQHAQLSCAHPASRPPRRAAAPTTQTGSPARRARRCRRTPRASRSAGRSRSRPVRRRHVGDGQPHEHGGDRALA